MKKIFLLLVFILSLAAQANSGAQSALKKISLMKYVTQEEAKYGHDYHLSLFHFSLIPEAYAYSEGSACLILGFQSTFKGGMCRLSKAQGAKELVGSCKKGQLPCNPVVFGSNGDKPFCVSNSGGELSRFCSHESFKSLSKSSSFKKFSPASQAKLKEIIRTSPRDFSFSQVKDLVSDEKFNEAFLESFQGGLEDSQKFTDELCQTIAASPKKNRAHELDIANCSAQLDILKSVKVDKAQIAEAEAQEVKKEQPKEETKKEQPKEATLVEPEEKVEQVVVEEKVEISDKEKQCIPPEALIVDEKKIEPIQKVPEMLEAKTWSDCAQELYSHKDIPEETRGNYYHDIDGKKNFAKQCWNLDGYSEKEMVYTFLSDTGFKMMKFPVYKYKENGETATLPRNMFRFKVDGKNYLLSNFDNIGEYFDSLPEGQLTSFAKERDLWASPMVIRKRYIEGYEKFLSLNGQKTPSLVDPSEIGLSIEDAKSCIKTRLLEYVSIVWYKTKPEALPRVNTLNIDLSRSDKKAPDLQERYGKSVNEIRKEMRESFFPEGSSCKGLFKDEEMDAMFDKNYKDRIDNYERVRKYFVP